MRTWSYCRRGLDIALTAAFLVGCGSSAGTAPQTNNDAGLSAQTRSMANRTASSYHVLAQFPPNGEEGDDPQGELLDVYGTLFGTAEYGGTENEGTVYTISSSNKETVLYRFDGSSGANPLAGLIDVGGVLYGTAPNGGKFGGGVVYSISTSGVQMVLYAFAQEPDGAGPLSGLTYANGLLYGTTQNGGKYARGTGTVYSITTGGQEKVLHRFADFAHGIYPGPGSLAFVSGTLYGTTSAGGTGCGDLGCGTVYSISANGKEKVLHAFTGAPDGSNPEGGLIDINGTLYGTTQYGGGSGRCNSFDRPGCGTVFTITPQGQETVLYSFKGGYDGARPLAGLIDVDGTLYGTTSWGGGEGCHSKPGGCGTIFSMSTSGVETVLHAFRGGADGAHPGYGSLTNVNGTLYGTTQGRGRGPQRRGPGTVFTLTAQR